MEPGQLLPRVTGPLADWWESAVGDAVTRCPAPENAVRQSYTRSGRPRIIRTVRRSLTIMGLISTGDGRVVLPSLTIRMEWDGRARPTDVTWPFNVSTVGAVMNGVLRDALGPAWKPRAMPRNRKIREGKVFLDFSGRNAW